MVVISPVLSCLKKLEISLSTYENLMSTPESLPTAEPDSPQISVTIGESDLPSMTMKPDVERYVGVFLTGGKNESADAQTVYVKILKNGSSIRTLSASVSAGYFWTWEFFVEEVGLNDVIDIKMWATSSEVNWDYEARELQPNKTLWLKGKVLVFYEIMEISNHPALTKGNPYVYTYYWPRMYHKNSEAEYITPLQRKYEGWSFREEKGFWEVYLGSVYSYNNGFMKTHSSYRPYYYQNKFPTKMRMRFLQAKM